MNKLRTYIKQRDNNTCRFCASTEDIQVHHITPTVLGGKNTEENLICLCRKCHHFIHYCNPMVRFGKTALCHKQLTREGLKKAAAQGKKLGRPRKTEL